MATKVNNSLIVGLDIGTTKIAVIVADRLPGGKVDIIGIGTHPSEGLRKGVVINIEATVNSIQRAIEEAELMAGCHITSVFAGIAGSHIKGFNSHGIVAIKNKEVSPKDIERVIDAAKAVAIPMDREILHILPQEYIVDEQDGIREPLGMSGVRLEAKVHIVTGAVASAQNIVKSANRVGLSVEDIVLEPIASAEAVLSPEEKELGVAMVDIGGGTTDLTIFHAGAVKHTAVIPLGGNHITNDISAGLRTPVSSAELIKRKYGLAYRAMSKPQDTIEVPSTGGRDPRILPKHSLTEIIEARLEEIYTLVHREIIRSGFDEFLTAGLVLTGGTVLLEGSAELAEDVFNLPVRVGYPTGVGGLIDVVNSPAFATGVGLVIYGARNSQIIEYGRGRSFTNDSSSAHGFTIFERIKERMTSWFSGVPTS
ncbi:MAG TPA: cell division protein FtsA [Oligoflexia bacterium]|nr:cell division protein FtsA [Oligoflexia bacterium]HMP47692.1 cell division protein FtsA [Oligoflexia bacterium]